MFDISSIEVAETTDVHLRDPEGELIYTPDGKPVTVTIYGPGSKPFAKAQAAQQNKALERLKKKGKFEQSADERAAEKAEFLASCTKSFNNFTYKGMEGREQFVAFYADQTRGFLVDQIDKEMGDWANFTGKSSTN